MPSPSFEGISDSQLETVVPAGAASGPIKVTNTAGSVTSSINFTLNSTLPLITSFSPASGPPGTAVIIKGINFTSATAVTFNWRPATFTVASANQINTSVPGGATSGKVYVVTPSGTATSSVIFSVNSTAAPTISSFSPTSGVVATTVTLTGTNFTGTKAVSFNGQTTTNFTGISNTRRRSQGHHAGRRCLEKRWHFSAIPLRPKGHWQGLGLRLPYRSAGVQEEIPVLVLPASPFGANRQTSLSGYRFFTSSGDASL